MATPSKKFTFAEQEDVHQHSNSVMAMPEHVLNPSPLAYERWSYVVLDFEIDTSHGDFGHPVHPDNQMLLACWKLGSGHPDYEEEVTYAQWGDEYSMLPLVTAIERADFLVAHNAKYELGWLKRCGLDLSSVLVFDTKLAEYVLFGNMTSKPHYAKTSLNECCKRRGWRPKDPVVDRMMRDGVNPVRMPRAWLQQRCETDVRSTEKLFRSQVKRLKEDGLLAIQYTRCLLTPVLADIEFNGMYLDPERLAQVYEERQQRYNQLCQEMEDLTGGINWNSSKQIAEYVYGTLGFLEKVNKSGVPVRTASGKPKTDQHTLESMKAKTEEQKRFLSLYKELNKLSAAFSKALEFFKVVCEKQGGVFYAEFNQTVTATHRLSSSGMVVENKRAQFQNLANEFKRLFRARKEGWLFTEWDGSGLEFRGAGLISGDPMIHQDINSGRDPHSFSGSVMAKMSYEDFKEKVDSGDKVFKERRRKAKADTFKPLFGGQSGTKEQKNYYKAFNERYKVLGSVQSAWVEKVLETKRLRLPWGMIFHFPQVHRSQDGYVNVRTHIYNYPIQSISTAEIIPLALVWFWHAIRARGLENYIVVVNTVHDSVLCEVHEDYVEEYRELSLAAWEYVYQYFETVYAFPLKGLPLGTELTIGTHWGEGEEESYNIWPDGRREEL